MFKRVKSILAYADACAMSEAQLSNMLDAIIMTVP